MSRLVDGVPAGEHMDSPRFIPSVARGHPLCARH